MNGNWYTEPESTWWNWWQATVDVATSFVAALSLASLLFTLLSLPPEVPPGSFKGWFFEFTIWMAYAAVFGLMIWFGRRRGISNLSLWSSPPGMPAQAWPLLLVLGCLWLYFADQVLYAFFAGEAEAEFTYWTSELSKPTWPLVAIAAIAIAPFGEELVFRRILLRAWSNTRAGFVGAAVLSSILWSFNHFSSLPVTVILFFEGLILCWLARRLQSIWPGIALHMANNAIATILGLHHVWSGG